VSDEKLRGVVIPVMTPTNKREDVDEPAFRRILRRLIDSGVHAIFAGGSAGEGPLLTDRQWRRMMEIACDEVAGAIPLLGGAIDTSSRRVCDKAKTLAKIGFRHYVVTPTYYIGLKSPAEHIRLYGKAKEAGGDMEMIAYNIPQCVGSAISVDTMCELVQRGWIRYCKESGGDFAYLEELIRRSKEIGLTVLAGDEPTSGKALLAGAKGIVPVCGNYYPGLFLRLFEAGSRGDKDEVDRLMPKVMWVREKLLLSGPCWLTGIKYALSQLGFGLGQPLAPLEPADAQRKATIDALIAEGME
jgi:4-hydroxy-tetrahydrodipicolinate synthase